MKEEIDLTEDDERALDRAWGIDSERENQDRGPTLLLQSSRNVRAPLHEGLEFVDETVGAMSAANPVAMEDITGQILRVLADAKDYTDARKRLQDAFPTMDRTQLRNMLTGGMLIAQAAGMESVQREDIGAGKVLRSGRNERIMSEELMLDFNPSQPRDEDGRFASKGFSRAGSHGEGGRKTASGADLPDHIKRLTIPPAWTDVHYNPDPNGDLLVAGKDGKGRWQSVYSEKHWADAAKAKFGRIEEMQQKFPEIVKQNSRDLTHPDDRIRQHAEVLHVVAHTGLRPGGTADTGAEKEAFGATTLQKRHVQVDADGNVRLQFVGKKGVDLDIPIKDKQSADILRARKNAAKGDDDDIFPRVSAASLSDRAHEMDGGGFKTKDFRTHHGTATAAAEVARMPKPRDKKAYEAQVREVAKKVSSELGNTPTVALQSYINPAVFQEWRAGVEGLE